MVQQKFRTYIGRAVGPGDLWLYPIDGHSALDENAEATAPSSPPSIATTTFYILPYKQEEVKYTPPLIRVRTSQ